MTNFVYNVVCYDGVDAYCIKAIGRDTEEAKETFKNTDLQITLIDRLYEWDDLEEHISGALQGKWELADGDKDLAMAIKRLVTLRTGMDLLGQFC